MILTWILRVFWRNIFNCQCALSVHKMCGVQALRAASPNIESCHTMAINIVVYAVAAARRFFYFFFFSFLLAARSIALIQKLSVFYFYFLLFQLHRLLLLCKIVVKKQRRGKKKTAECVVHKSNCDHCWDCFRRVCRNRTYFWPFRCVCVRAHCYTRGACIRSVQCATTMYRAQV